MRSSPTAAQPRSRLHLLPYRGAELFAKLSPAAGKKSNPGQRHSDTPALDVCFPVTYKMPLVDDGFEALLEPFYNGKKLTDPISTKEDKFQLLPAFLKVKGKGATPSSSSSHANIPRTCEAVCTDSPLARAETSRHRPLADTNPGTLTHTTSSSNKKSRTSCGPTELSAAMWTVTSGLSRCAWMKSPGYLLTCTQVYRYSSRSSPTPRLERCQVPHRGYSHGVPSARYDICGAYPS